MDKRFDLPAAYADPAFIACVTEAIETPELVASFDRLYGATLSGRPTPIERMVDVATGKAADDMLAFAEFIHRGVYMALPGEAIHSLRAAALVAMGEPEPQRSGSGS